VQITVTDKGGAEVTASFKIQVKTPEQIEKEEVQETTEQSSNSTDAGNSTTNATIAFTFDAN